MAEEEAAAIPNQPEGQQDRQIAIQKIYMKDFSFESPNSPQVFTGGDWAPKTNLNLRSGHAQVSENIHEVVLTLTVEAKHEENTLFLVEVHQAGLFLIDGYTPEEFEAIVGSFCPATLFPFAREAIANVVSRGGFPEFVLQPINFDALFAETKRKAAEAAAAQPAADDAPEVSH